MNLKIVGSIPFILAIASASHCPEKSCSSQTEDRPDDEHRFPTPWHLSKYPDYKISDTKLHELMNKQINLELQAFYTYLSIAFHFSRDDVAQMGFHKFFKAAADEEYGHAMKLMNYMNQRGTEIRFSNLSVPCQSELLVGENEVPRTFGTDKHCHTLEAKVVRKQSTASPSQYTCEWGDALSAVTAARQLEIHVWRHLKLVHLHADKTKDANLQDLIEEFLAEQVTSIKELSDLATRLKRVEPCLGFHMIDKELEKET